MATKITGSNAIEIQIRFVETHKMVSLILMPTLSVWPRCGHTSFPAQRLSLAQKTQKHFRDNNEKSISKPCRQRES